MLSCSIFQSCFFNYIRPFDCDSQKLEIFDNPPNRETVWCSLYLLLHCWQLIRPFIFFFPPSTILHCTIWPRSCSPFAGRHLLSWRWWMLKGGVEKVVFEQHWYIRPPPSTEGESIPGYITCSPVYIWRDLRICFSHRFYIFSRLTPIYLRAYWGFLSGRLELLKRLAPCLLYYTRIHCGRK